MLVQKIADLSMSEPLSPRTKPLERLWVSDGLLINAERWQLAHDYHRERQNVHYQGVNLPGIIWGLGVGCVPPPRDIPVQFRDGRWLQIQSGMAIDRCGNPIIVPQPLDFRIASNPTDQPRTIYLVISYVDPGQLQRSNDAEVVQETFRINEKDDPPEPLEIELCRIHLQPNTQRLSPSTDVLAPEDNTLDLRYREAARSRSPLTVQAAYLETAPPEIPTRLNFLLQSLPGLYPALQGLPVQAASQLSKEPDLLYLTQAQLNGLPNLEQLVAYLQTGGVVLVEANPRGSKVFELQEAEQQLQEAIRQLAAGVPFQSPNQTAELARIREDLTTELTGLRQDLEQQIRQLTQRTQELAQQLGTPPQPLFHPGPPHLLRTQPFLFAIPPTLTQFPLQIWVAGGIVLVVGDLAVAWGLDDTLALPRETIRTAQELGINLLHYACRRHTLTRDQQVPAVAPTENLTQRKLRPEILEP